MTSTRQTKWSDLKAGALVWLPPNPAEGILHGMTARFESVETDQRGASFAYVRDDEGLAEVPITSRDEFVTEIVTEIVVTGGNWSPALSEQAEERNHRQ